VLPPKKRPAVPRQQGREIHAAEQLANPAPVRISPSIHIFADCSGSISGCLQFL
jgi:hypothetical protein